MFSKLNNMIGVLTILYSFINVAVSTSEKVLPFKQLVEMNMQFPKVTDICMMRIAGGDVAPAQYVPYQVAIKQNVLNLWITYCGGSLITYEYILTSAHCFCGDDGKIIKGLESLRIVAGSERSVSTPQQMVFEQSRKLKNFWRHQKYDLRQYKHDIGVVLVEYRFFPAPSIRPVPMKRNNSDTNFTMDIGEQCAIAGYGVREYEQVSKDLRLVCIPQRLDKTCEHYYGKTYVKAEMICAGSKGKDSCAGDSGGALVCDGIQFGIMTFGSSCGSFPGIYTKLEFYTEQNLIFMNRMPRGIVLPRNLYYTALLSCLYQYYF